MLRRIVLLALCLAFPRLALAQDWVGDYQRQFQAGIDSLTAGRLDEGIASFRRCIELNPSPDATCAYNIACAYSLKKEADPAFEWLGKAAVWGFGNSDGNIDHAKQDTDLASLRADPRFDAFIADMTRIRAELEAYWSVPEVYVPAALADAEALPLLVVLHEVGGTKTETLERWMPVADALGSALIAPSGKHTVGGPPEEGMSWFDDPNAYGQRYWSYERTVNDAVSAFRKEHGLDKERVYLAGEGQGGMVAFNVAIAGPGLYKGVVVVNGGVHLELALKKTATAAKMGFGASLIAVDGAIAGLPQGLTTEALLAGAARQLEQGGLRGVRHAVLPAGTEPAALQARIVEALRAFQTVSAPAPAGGDQDR